MPNSRFLNIVLMVCSIALIGVGCSKPADDTPASALRSGDGILKYIPAETPYVFAMPAAIPEDVLDKLEPHIDAILSSYREIVSMAIDSVAAETADDAEDAENIQNFVSVAEEFMGLMSYSELRAAGLPRNARAAFYGVGMLPVLRVKLDDAAAFEKTITRFEETAGASMSTASIDGHSYRYAGDDELRIILGILDDHIVVTLVPAALSEERLAAVLGIELPAQNIGESGGLENIANDYGYAPYALGYIDFERLISTFLDNQDGVNAELLALMDYENELTDVCRAEIREMSGIMPRLVSGYTEISVERFSSNTIIELRSDIAAGFAGLVASVPGLGIDHGGLISFGLSIDLLGAREFYEARLDALEADPYQCELFADMQNGVAAGRQALDQPIPPIAYDFNGFLAVIDNIEGFDFASQKPPSAIDMGLLIATKNAEGLIAMGSMFSPELAALNLQPDGQPVKVEVPPVGVQFDSVFIGMNESGLVIAVGDNAESRVSEMLSAKAGDPPPFVSMSMDSAKYYELIGNTMMAGSTEADENSEAPEMSPDAEKAIGDVLQELGKIIDRIAVDINFTERGIEFPTTVTLAP